MKKQIQIIGIMLAVIALCSVALLISRHDLGSNQGNKNAESASPVLQEKIGAIQGLDVKNAAGGYQAKIENGAITILGLEEDIPLDSAVLEDLISDITYIPIVQEVTEGKNRLAEFGLESPACEVSIQKTDGTTMYLTVGNEVPGIDAAASYIAYDDRVAVVYDTNLRAFRLGLADLISKEVTPAYQPDKNIWMIERAAVTETTAVQPLIIAEQDTSTVSGVVLNNYELESPIKYPADTKLTEKFLNTLFNIRAESVITIHPQEEQLVSLGLDAPFKTLEMQWLDEKKSEHLCRVFLSEEDANHEAYALREGVPVVYRVNLSNAAWKNSTAEELMSRTILSPALVNLSWMTIRDSDGKEYTFSLDRTDEEKQEDYRVICGNVMIDRDSFRNFYYQIVDLTADKVLLQNKPDPANMSQVLQITWQMRESTEINSVDFYKNDGATAYAVRGNIEFELNFSQIMVLQETLHRLIAGEKIDARY